MPYCEKIRTCAIRDDRCESVSYPQNSCFKMPSKATDQTHLVGSAGFAGSLTSLADVKTALKEFINSRELEDGEVCNECIDIVHNWVDAFFDNTKTQ